MTLQLHKPDGRGGVRPTAQLNDDWREELRATRWRVAPLRNTEMNPTSTRAAIAFWVFLAGLTFGLLMLGYGTNFWR
jgi:hypothetical protein